MMSNSKILVSVWMITYNQQKYIANAIESVLMQQTNFDIEIVIGEDCSTDKTRDILKEYEKKYPSIIRVIYQGRNVGANLNAFKYTLPLCKGEYLSFLEGDDYWVDPYKLQKQVDFMEQNKDYGLIYTDVDFYYESSGKVEKSIFKTGYFPSYTFDQFLISGGYIAPCTWLIRKQSMPSQIDLDSTDASFSLALDIWSNYKVKYLNDTTAVYRISNGSSSYPESLILKYKREKGLYKIKTDYCNRNHVPESVKSEISNYYTYRLRSLLSGSLNMNSSAAREEWNNFFENIDCDDLHLIKALGEEIVAIKGSVEYSLGTLISKPYFILNKVLRKILRSKPHKS